MEQDRAEDAQLSGLGAHGGQSHPLGFEKQAKFDLWERKASKSFQSLNIK